MCCDSTVDEADEIDDPLSTLGGGGVMGGVGLGGARGGGAGRAGSPTANEGVFCGVAASAIGRGGVSAKRSSASRSHSGSSSSASASASACASSVRHKRGKS